MASSSEEDNATVSGLTDFSRFCPADKIKEKQAGKDSEDEEIKPVRYRPKGTTWFSRIGKSSSLTSVDTSNLVEEGGKGEKKLRKYHKFQSKSRNSLPEEAILPALLQEDKADRHNASPIDVSMSHLQSLQKELEALKGCVSKQRAVFSPSHSPDLCCLEEEPYPKPHPPPLVVDEPFNIFTESPSDNIIFPLEEYCVQVEPFYPTSEEPLQDGESPTSFAENRLERQGSLEYDHLENQEEEGERAEPQEDGLSPPKSDSGSYFVAVQFSEEENKDVKTSTLATNDDVVPSRKNSVISVHDVISKQPQQPLPPFLTLQHGKPSPINARPSRMSSSIPGRLNSPSLSRITSPSHTSYLSNQHCWSSTSQLARTEACHCPSCCSCGSSLRRFAGKNGRSSSGHTRQASYDLSRSGLAFYSCPLKRYNKSLQLVQQPQVSRLVLDRTVRRNEESGEKKETEENSKTREEPLTNTVSINSFTSHDGGPTNNTSSDIASVLEGDFDTQSLWSVPSIHSTCSFSGPPHLHTPSVPPPPCCDRSHVSYNNGVDVNVFKERLDVRSLKKHVLYMYMYIFKIYCNTTAFVYCVYVHVHVVVPMIERSVHFYFIFIVDLHVHVHFLLIMLILSLYVQVCIYWLFMLKYYGNLTYKYNDLLYLCGWVDHVHVVIIVLIKLFFIFQLISQWFSEFSDTQRNTLLQKILVMNDTCTCTPTVYI